MRRARCVGIVTEGDFLRRGETETERKRPRSMEFLMGPGKMAEEYVRSHARRIDDVMTRDPLTVAEDTPLEEVVSLMERRRIKRVPVVRDGKVVGIIARSNLLRALASAAPTLPARPTSDATIRKQLGEELERQHWAPAGAIEIVVIDGLVHLWGTITDERARRAIVVAAENIAGVKGVRDHMAWLDPASGMVFAAPEMSPDRSLVQ